MMVLIHIYLYHNNIILILLDSILFDPNNKHYPQIFLKKCVYAVNKQASLCKYIDKSNDESNNKSNDKSNDKSYDKSTDKF